VTGRAWAYTGAVLGAAVSIAANVSHAYVPPTAAPASWSPQPGAVTGAVFWPVALLVALEILARVAWPAQARWLAVRWLGLTPVCLVAAVVSYRHLSGLLAWYGEDPITSTIGPLAVDGLMALASGALLVHPPAATEEAVTVDVVQVRPVAAVAAAESARVEVTEQVPVGPGRRTDEDLIAAARAAITAGMLPADPSGAQLRHHLEIGADRARRIRDQLQEVRHG